MRPAWRVRTKATWSGITATLLAVRLQHLNQPRDTLGRHRPRLIEILSRRASDVHLTNASRADDLSQHRFVDAAAGDDGETSAGTPLIRCESLAPRRRHALAAAGQDSI